ncbi:MAG: hypothetical protein ACLSVD_07095 [Eggerthellaceae bacterium]
MALASGFAAGLSIAAGMGAQGGSGSSAACRDRDVRMRLSRQSCWRMALAYANRFENPRRSGE